MAIKPLFERYNFPGVPKLDVVLQDFRRKTNELIDYFLGTDFGNLRLYDTDQSDLLDIKWNENESNPYTLNLKVNSANRTIDLSGNLTVESASIINSDLSTDANWATTGTLGSGQLTVDSGTDCSIIIKGTSTGNANIGWIGFYDSDGITRRGSIGDGSVGDDDIYIGADTGYLRLYATAGYIGLGTHTYLPDDVAMSFGASLDYSIGYYSTDGEFQIVDGSTLDSNVRLKLDSSGHFDFGAGNLTTTGTLAGGDTTITGITTLYKAGQEVDININAEADQNAQVVLQTAGSDEWAIYRPASSVDLRVHESGVADQFTFGAGGNFGIGVIAFGSSAGRLLGIGGSTAPTTSPANMIQMWSEDRGGNAGYSQLHYLAESGKVRPLVREFDVSDYGLVPDDNTGSVPANNVTAWTALIGDVAAGDKIYFPKGTWYVNDSLAISQAVLVYGDGAGSKIEETVNSKNILDVSSSNVIIEKLNIVGTGQASTGGTAIDASGADANGYLNKIKIIDCIISACNYGVVTRWIEQFEFKGNNITDVEAAGILMFYSQDGEVHHNYIEDVDAVQGYGIIATRAAGTLATYPRSARIKIHDNIIKDVLTWEGIDTHSGDQIDIYNNTVILCKRGIMVGGDSDTPDHEPIDCSVTGNTIDSSTIADNTRNEAINFAGTSNGAATGIIANNTIRGHGKADSAIQAAIIVATTQGLVISGNTLIEPSPYGIMLSSANEGFVVTGNTIIDPFTDAVGVGEVDGIVSDLTNNVGYIGGNSFIRGTKSATYVLDSSGTAWAIRIDDNAGTDIVIGSNYSEADVYLLDPGSNTSTINHDNLTGFVSAEHVSLPNTIANVLSDHTLAGHVTLGLFAAVSAVNLGIAKATPIIQLTDSTHGTAFDIIHHSSGSFTLGETGAYDIEILAANAGIKMANLKSGTDQSDASAAANELYIDENDNSIKIGV